jgi:hypothetical protein
MKLEKGSSSGMAKVYSAPNLAESDLVAAILEANGIPAVVKNAVLAAWVGWATSFYHAGYQVLVPADEAEKARAVLESGRGSDWSCPKCGEKIDGVFDACWNCGYELDKE